MNGNTAYVLSKKFCKDTVIGMGALKGAPCTIKSITPSSDNRYNTIVFEWEDTTGAKHTSSLVVYNGYVTNVTPLLNKGTKIATMTTVSGGTVDIYAPEGGGGSGELQDVLTASVNVGGVNAGDSFAKKTPIETVLRAILDPVLYPTFTNPSATLTATGAKLLEKGSSLATTFTVTFNRGAITPAYGTNGYRSGAASGYSLNGGTSQSGNTFNVTVTEATTSYQASVSYAAGQQPKDSAGNNYSTPLPAGSVNSNTVSYEFVDALWSNQANITTVAKMTLVSKTAKQKDIVFPAQTVSNPEVFDVPASWTVTAVQVKNDLSGAYEDALDQFTVTNITHTDASGNTVNYKRYTFNLGYDTGSRTVRLKWS